MHTFRSLSQRYLAPNVIVRQQIDADSARCGGLRHRSGVDAIPTVPALGFGCASLYGLPTVRERRSMLEVAYDLGIRHFDVAPMYGLGRAEAELAEFIGTRPDVLIATKFGIRVSSVGRFAGVVQPPVRRVLAAAPATKAALKDSGRKRDAGRIGRMLYSQHDYSVANARRSLVSSLKKMKVDRLDYFLLHEPAGALRFDNGAVADFLEREQRKGTIGQWGPAGDLSGVDANIADLLHRATVRQIPYDLVDGPRGTAPEAGKFAITFGFISSALPVVKALLEKDDELLRDCSTLLDADLADSRNVVGLLVRDALAHNNSGITLVSSTNPRNLRGLWQVAHTPMRNEGAAADLIRMKCREMCAI